MNDHYNTKQAAEIFGVRPETMRQSVWLHGHYKWIFPVKHKGNNYWPKNQVDALSAKVGK